MAREVILGVKGYCMSDTAVLFRNYALAAPKRKADSLILNDFFDMLLEHIMLSVKQMKRQSPDDVSLIVEREEAHWDAFLLLHQPDVESAEMLFYARIMIVEPRFFNQFLAYQVIGCEE